MRGNKALYQEYLAEGVDKYITFHDWLKLKELEVDAVKMKNKVRKEVDKIER